MSALIIGIGIPGSGKTTFLKKIAEEKGYAYIAPDDIREELTGDARDQTRNKDAWDIAQERMRTSLSEGTGVVFDATFAKGHERRAFLAEARDKGATRIEGYWFDVPLEVARARNQARMRRVRDHALVRMDTLIREDPPLLSEGLDALVRMDEEGRVRN